MTDASDDGALRDDDLLNESQQQRLSATCRYIDGLLGGVEVILPCSY